MKKEKGERKKEETEKEERETGELYAGINPLELNC